LPPDHASEVSNFVLVQVYRSPPGQLETEVVMEGDGTLVVNDVTLEFASVPYARLTVTFNPGLWPTGVGLVLLIVGVVGSVTWPVRRFWLREEEGRGEGCGDLPLSFLGSEER
jgi:hypothetical protein